MTVTSDLGEPSAVQIAIEHRRRTLGKDRTEALALIEKARCDLEAAQHDVDWIDRQLVELDAALADPTPVEPGIVTLVELETLTEAVVFVHEHGTQLVLMSTGRRALVWESGPPTSTLCARWVDDTPTSAVFLAGPVLAFPLTVVMVRP